MTVSTIRTLENFVGGCWVPASTDATVDDLDPADPSDVLARIPLSSAEDARAAVDFFTQTKTVYIDYS